jgi:rod shape determining protein RodA
MRLPSALFRFDWLLLLCAFTLMAVGLIVIYGIGISRPETDLFLFQKHAAAAVIGGIIIIALGFFDYRHLRGLAIPVYIFGAVLLLGVLFFGHTVRGTRGWYVVGGLSFQPVETAKLCLIVFLASYLSRWTHRTLPWHVLAGSFFATAVYMVLVMFQPDFGSSMVLVALWGALVLFTGIGWKRVLLLGGVGLAAGVLAWNFALQPFQRNRIMAFMNPALDTRGAGYNVTQAQIAIGSGGLFGKGIGEGSQARLRFLPEAATDFTFAVVGEELGFTGIAFILGLFVLLFYRLMTNAQAAEDDFATLLAIGISAFFLIHILINGGMNLGIMPVTGIPFPFLSAASSFVLAAALALGISESIAVRRRSAG